MLSIATMTGANVFIGVLPAAVEQDATNRKGSLFLEEAAKISFEPANDGL